MKKINWEDVPAENVNASMTRKIIIGEKLMIARIKFKDGFLVPLHHHFHEQVTHTWAPPRRDWLDKTDDYLRT